MCLMPRQHCPRTRYLVSPELTGGEIRPEFRLFPSRARGGVFDLFYPFHHQPQAGGRGWRGGEAPPQPSPRGGGGSRGGELAETSGEGAQVPCHQLPRRGICFIEMCRMVFCDIRVFRV